MVRFFWRERRCLIGTFIGVRLPQVLTALRRVDLVRLGGLKAQCHPSLGQRPRSVFPPESNAASVPQVFALQCVTPGEVRVPCGGAFGAQRTTLGDW